MGNIPKATDSELTDFLCKHIDNPCEAEISPGLFQNIRDIYIREAKRILPEFTDVDAKAKLEAKIQQYENPGT